MLLFGGAKANSVLADLERAAFQAANMIASTRRDNGSRVEESKNACDTKLIPRSLGTWRRSA